MFKLLWDLDQSAATSIVVGVRRNMEFEQLEAEAQNLTTDNEKLAQALRASALEEDDDDEDNLDVVDDSEALDTDNEGLDEDEGEEEEDHALRDEQAVAAMRQLGTAVGHSYPPLPSGCDFVQLPDDHRSSNLYSEPTYHMIAPSPDVSAVHDGTSTSISIPRVDPVEIRRALALNLQYRETLKQQLKNIEEARARNADYQKKIKALIVQGQKKTARKPGKRSFTAPYFATASGQVPPDNRDTVKRKDYLKRMPTGFKCKKWNQNEEKALASGVRTMNQGIIWSRMMETSQARTSEDLQREREAIKRMPTEQLELNLEGIDWEVLSKVHVPTRSPMDCKIHWTQVMHPQINKKKFTKEEDQRLLALANEHKGHNWQSIAVALGTGRTPAQCMQRYQRSLNTNIMRGKWTKQEDRELIEAVRVCGNKNWQQVAHCLKDRTGQQCLHRWQKTLSPDIRKGRWSPLEDMMLTLSVKAYGENLSWVKVQTQIPGRTDVQCRERWVNILNPGLNVGPWTEEEDEKLRQHVEAHGAGKWAEIARILRPRTDNQCWRRWKSLNSGVEVANYRKSVHKKKKGLVNNFVGREKERPDLTIGDFPAQDDDDEEPPRRPPSPTPNPMPATSPTPLHLQLDLLSSGDSSSLPAPPLYTASSSSTSTSLVILPMEESSSTNAGGDGEEEEGEEEDEGVGRKKGGASTRGRKRKAVTRKAPAAAKKAKTTKKTPTKRASAKTASKETPADGDAASTPAPAPRKRGRPRKVVASTSTSPPSEPATESRGGDETPPTTVTTATAAAEKQQTNGVESPTMNEAPAPESTAAAEKTAASDSLRRSARVPKKRKAYGHD